MKRTLLTLAAVAALSSLSTAAETGLLGRSIALAGQRYLYPVYVPLDWAPTQKWPVVLFLHGNGSQGSDGLRHIPVGSLIAAIRAHRDRFPAVIVFPQAREGTRWSTPAMQDMVLAQLDSAIEEFNGDPTRVYLTGFSMGGGGVVRIASRWPERFAALIDMSGRISVNGTTRDQPSTDEDVRTHAYLRSADPYDEAARLIRAIPIWVFHGGADQTVPVQESRRLVTALKAVGADVRYTEYPGLDHNPTPPQAWGEKGLSQWLFAQHRPEAAK
ncbi:MAG: hypothetical protein A3G20_01915 [Acidobacteria bacterium RIFCSPLOWO2_12_FULL_59_11]|nr:MAG: hypothetical protein A3G20_01915 [Acidobacteria bacterium RIFCSPLOWO2_12_FULL_59_11]